jgi:HEAT repeat protein
MRFPRLLLIIWIGCLFSQYATGSSHAQDYRGQVDTLLRKLKASVIKEEANSITLGPTLETQEEVHAGLKRIADESAEGRSEVIGSLIRILKDPAELRPDLERPFGMALRWTYAVRVLGEIRATEAIDILVRNIDETGEFGIISSIHYRPVASALGKIGEPAVPRLIEALSERNTNTRVEVASTLARIGEPALARLGEALRDGDPGTRGGAALALGWIGGYEAKAGVERAIRKETDENALKEMRYALSRF